MTQPIKDQDGDTVMGTAGPTNTHGLTDNCYYVCAARLSGMTTDELVKATEQMQINGGTDVDGIKSLFTQAGLGATVRACGSVAGVRAAVMSIPGPANAFGVAFIRLDGSGHMVIAHRGTGGVAFRDYQMDDAGADATADLNTGTSFWVFH